MWRAQEGATLPHRSHRGGMDPLGTAHSHGQTRWSPAHDREACGGQGQLLRAAGWRPMAPAPASVSAPPDGLPCLPDLAMGRRLGAAARPPAWGAARGRGPHAGAQGGAHRASDGAAHRTRGGRGSAGGKRLRGRQRHSVVEVLGLLLVVLGHAAGLQDREGAPPGLTALGARFPGLQRIWAEGGDAGKRVAWGTPGLQRPRGMVQRPRHTQGLQVGQGRWIVERTLGWLQRSRRRRQDLEALPATTETWGRIAMLPRRVRRLAARA